MNMTTMMMMKININYISGSTTNHDDDGLGFDPLMIGAPRAAREAEPVVRMMT